MSRIVSDEVSKLRKDGVQLWSISRLNTYDTCPYSYYKTYILGDRGRPNLYSSMGSIVHDALQHIYDGNEDLDLTSVLEDGIIEGEVLGFSFPSESIGKSWLSDMRQFCATFKKMDIPLKTEEEILVEVDDGIWMFGYSDATYYDGEFAEVYDWKTSSEFRGDKLLEAGRQLCVYALAKQAEGYKVRKVAWNMLKYMYVSYTLKNGNIKRTMCNRGKWVMKMDKPIRAQFPKTMDDFEIDMLMDLAIEKNEIQGVLPQEIVDKFTIEDCILEYDLTDEVIAETVKYIKSTVKKISSKGKSEEEWEPVEISDKTSFFCSQLCNHGYTCKFYKQYMQNKVE